MVVQKKLMTAEEFAEFCCQRPMDANKYELVRGKLITMPPAGWYHSHSTMSSSGVIWTFVRAHDLGELFSGDPGFVLERRPDTVRAPDLAFFAKHRLPDPDGPGPFFGEVVPDFVLGVVSLGKPRRDLETKVQEYLAKGVRLIWVVDPRPRTLTVYQPNKPPRTFTETDEVEGDPVFPGFRCRVADLF